VPVFDHPGDQPANSLSGGQPAIHACIHSQDFTDIHTDVYTYTYICTAKYIDRQVPIHS
jgi:hypothetical protein